MPHLSQINICVAHLKKYPKQVATLRTITIIVVVVITTTTTKTTPGVLATKPDDRNSIPGVYIMEGKIELLKVGLYSDLHTGTCVGENE